MTDKRMTNAEAVILCRFAKACCPQQAFDAYTPDAWYELLGDLRFEDCKEALTRVVKRQPFVAPAEIRDEVKSVRWDRIVAFDKLVPNRLEAPRHMADEEPWVEVEWRREIQTRIADGEITHPSQIDDRGEVVGDYPHRDVIAELGQLGREVPEE